MKKTIQILMIIALAGFISACQSSKGFNDVPPIVLGPIKTSNESMAVFLERIVEDCRKQYPDLHVSISFLLRDCRVVEEPSQATCNEGDLFSRYEDSRSATNKTVMGDLPTFTCDMPRMPLDKILKIATSVTDYDYDIRGGDKGNVTILIGPNELAGSRPSLRRITYRIPEPLRHLFVSLPRELAPRGSAIAFDPSTGLLTVIDNFMGSRSDEILRAIGAQPTKQDEPETPEF